MIPERRRRRDELFDALADLAPAEQQHMLREACGNDLELIHAVNELLEADRAGLPVCEPPAATLASHVLYRGDAIVPGKVGRYIIRERLGAGGMGAVYLAERETLGDRVAIKFLRNAGISDSERRRFTSEQRTLASLNHRHIARLYDSGLLEQTPWFAMEWVRGLTITKHCQVHSCSLTQRLLLLRSVCEAVVYAHRMLIIHRDLKPSNILVNSEGEVKLLDFGIAKHLAGAEDGQVTSGGLALSLNYAAPEQIRGERPGVAADVYSLGIVLCELLTGIAPADLSNASALELAHWLDREIDPPSLVARRRKAADSPLPAAAATQSQWKDLDLLCLTACRKQVDRRYRSVDDLIRDLDHFMKDEPLEAHADSWRYTFAKFLSRNRRAVSAAALVAALVAGMWAFFTWRLVSARNDALASQARTERMHRMMLNLFEGDDEAAGPAGDLRVIKLLDRGAASVAALASDPVIQTDLQSTLGDLYQKLGHPVRAEPLLRSAFDRRAALLGRDGVETIRSEIALALLLLDLDRSDEAESLARDAFARTRRRQRPDQLLPAYGALALGTVNSARGSYAQAVPLLEEAVKLYSAGPATADLSDAVGALANAEYLSGNVDASEYLNRRGLRIDTQLFGEKHPHVAVDLFNLGNIALDRGEYRVGEDLFRRSLAINTEWYSPAHPKAAAGLLMVGRALEYQGRFEEAAPLYGRALDIYKSVYGEQHLRVAQVLNSQGTLSLKTGKLDRAEQQFSRAAEIFKKALGDQHEFYAHQLSNLGAVELERGRYRRAEELLGAALGRMVPRLPGQRYTAIAHIRMAKALAGEKRYREAEEHALNGWRTLQNLRASTSEELQSAREVLATISIALHEPLPR
jgi:serine/threonine-protein kinase